jgi:hypothetical protein
MEINLKPGESGAKSTVESGLSIIYSALGRNSVEGLAERERLP